MKVTICLIAVVVLVQACGPTQVIVHENPVPVSPAPSEVSYQSFYDELSPYGRWIDYPGYGYVWMPEVGYGFKPYATNGHWVYTEEGWTWASDYAWGWATFHYGRWFFDAPYGWMWIPGHEWAPAWVSWRRSEEYYGWAPLGPNINFGVSFYNPPSNYWCFVPHEHLTNPHINNYYVNESKNVTIVNNTTVINNTTIINNNNTVINNNNISNNSGRNNYRGGPEASEVAHYTGAPVQPLAIRESNHPGEQLSAGQYNLFRPRVNASANTANSAGNNTARPAPTRVASLQEIKPVAAPVPNSLSPHTNPPVYPQRPATEPALNHNEYNAARQAPAQPTSVHLPPQEPTFQKPMSAPVSTHPSTNKPAANPTVSTNKVVAQQNTMQKPPQQVNAANKQVTKPQPAKPAPKKEEKADEKK